MDINVLRSKSREMLFKELLIALTAYNLVRKIIAKAAEKGGFSPQKDTCTVYEVLVLRTKYEYSKYIPASMHRIGKDNTWKIDRKNLNFRTHTCTVHTCAWTQCKQAHV